MDNNAKKGLNDIMGGGYNPYQELRHQTKKLVEKWKPSGLLEGMDKESFDQHSMAILLENQARQLIDESSGTNPSGGAGDEEWSGVALPLVRKVFGEIASKDFVSVQPMNLPSGLVFYLNFTYGGGGRIGDGFTAGSKIHGVTDTKDTDASGGLYGAGRYAFTANSASYTPGLTNWNFSVAGAVSNAATPKEVQFDTTSSTLYKISTTLPADADVEAVRSFDIECEDPVDLGVEPKYTTVVKDGNVYSASFYITNNLDSLAGYMLMTGSKVIYSKQPTEAARGDFEQTSAGFAANAETDINIPEIDVDLKSSAIVAKTRKLKAVWTPELAQDLNAYHSIDAEAELTSMLSEYISMEIDLEILDMLISNASTTEYWSADIGQEYNSATNTFGSATNANSYAYTKNEWFATLGNKIQRVSNKIHQKTMRGGANFLVCGPDVATVIESIPGWNVNTDGNQSNFAMGVEQVGTLRNRWTVYKNPYMQENTILCGFRGSNFLETGAVYAPYIPLIVTPLIYDPKNFQPRKGVMTRYAKKIVRPEFYGKIVVANPDQI